VTPPLRLRDNAAVPHDPDSSYSRIYAVVRRIPRGRVATYGQVARLAGLGGHARQVGYALHAMVTVRPLPWHRVINARGEVSPRSDPGSDLAQREFLEREGVVFDRSGRVDLARFQWRPRDLSPSSRL
jgi:methylated-DNA-protein-cysteine methyltransferase-like protein